MNPSSTHPPSQEDLAARDREEDIYLRWLAAVTASIRKQVTSDHPPNQETLLGLREELRLLTRPEKRRQAQGFNVDELVFSTLDPIAIRAYSETGRLFFGLELWNTIAPQISPEVIDAFNATCGKIGDLPLSLPGAAVLADPAFERLVSGWVEINAGVLSGLYTRGRSGSYPPHQVLLVMRHWIRKWPLERPFAEQERRHHELWASMRLIAALDGPVSDDWQAGPHDDLNASLALTRSAHGRLKLGALLSDPELLIRDAPAAFRLLAT